jgi:hypothetical protein
MAKRATRGFQICKVALAMKTHLFLTILLVACNSPDGKMNSKIEALKKKQEDIKKEKAKAEDALVPLAKEVIKLSAPYEEGDSIVLVPDGPCPEGFWSLFSGTAPGATAEEKKANEAKRKELATKLQSANYLVKYRGAQLIKMAEFNAPKGYFEVASAGSIDCHDSIGNVTISWTNAKAGDPGNSAAKEGAELRQLYWLAPTVDFTIPASSLTAAKEFEQKNKFAMSARVAGTFGKTEVHKKLIKVGKVQEKAAGETIGYGGGLEDWGAGRLLRLQVAGFRVATQLEAVELYETKTLSK